MPVSPRTKEQQPALYGVKVGDAFDKWTITGPASGRYRVMCRCLCGFEKSVYVYDLTNGTSTGCARCARKGPRLGRRIVRKVAHILSCKLRGAVRNAITRMVVGELRFMSLG